MRAHGARPRGPGAFESLRTNFLAIVEGVESGIGTIELEVVGRPAPGAQGHARGFVGIAWRLQDDHKTYDCFYAFSADNWRRPANELSTLMRLMESFLVREGTNCGRRGVWLELIGR